MKLRKLTSILVSVLMLGAFTSCLNDDDSKQTLVHGVDMSSDYFTERGVFKDVNVPSDGNVMLINSIRFSRDVNTTYNSFTGFQPSQCRSTEVPENFWPDYQWGVIDTNTPASTIYTFMVAYWNSMEDTAGIPATPSCRIAPLDGTFSPLFVFISNSAVTYKAMTEGLGFARKFTANDSCKLYIYGVRNNIRTQPVVVELGKCNESGVFTGITSWQAVDVKQLGEVDYIYFQMSSTDTGEYGINTPTYFCYYGMQAEY
ncbi:MAG: DUF4465 domain-containing protein [Muribaculaceae bacterium]|nr:DUF4465 domain-containing protein [Muribaculaceae bacterium]